MTTYFSALSAVMAHDFRKPEDTAPPAARADWWFERADLLSVLGRKTEDPFEWERVQNFVEEAESEAKRLVDLVPVTPWPVQSRDVDLGAVA
ncbi:hypothetical protein F4560_008721 [Saccharothrix ecbatanensis]|uniref:Uncharacterized protein n=1 Tax=Saccharothrix ecbatanensis TaxID=1105145 RepID=A0A7W9HUZ6_9PSEU|nr:hypothetical protein [Saccharothrix ecbatanensis]MBB5808953.1 hypothetical protein [Saccharothrix ecbatanensis]